MRATLGSTPRLASASMLRFSHNVGTNLESSMQIQTAQDVQRLVAGLIDSTWAFSALVAAAEIGLLDILDPSCTVAEAAARTGVADDLARALLDMLVALGLAGRDGDRYLAAPGFGEFLRTSQPDDTLAWLRSTHFQSSELVDAARRGSLQPGWIHTDPEILQAQGRTGRAPIHAMAAQAFPVLPGLEDRLRSRNATFLDVGIGVGIISIEMCRIYPQLRVVGLEPGEVQAAEARRNIAVAGLEDRIEVRPQRLEELNEREVFDLIYLPQVFMPMEVVRDGLGRVYQALRPGGWVFVLAITAPGEDLHAATTRLLNVMWGGSPLSAEEVADMTRAAGFESVQVGGPPGSLMKSIMGRRSVKALPKK
jgi:2-polyprenyl-3-methyl-5-hydroxy-6-metoxy-1,4-benzoquinol methylase